MKSRDDEASYQESKRAAVSKLIAKLLFFNIFWQNFSNKNIL